MNGKVAQWLKRAGVTALACLSVLAVAAPPAWALEDAQLSQEQVKQLAGYREDEDSFAPNAGAGGSGGSTSTAPVEEKETGEYFTANIKADGKDVPCTFQVLSKNGKTGTAEVSIAANNDRAIDTKTKGALSIPNTVTNKGVTYTVTKIGDGAFWTCEGITSTGLGSNSSVKEIGYRAYSRCDSLVDTGFATNKSVKTLNSGLVFMGCPALKDTGLGSNTTITELPGSIFADCEALTDTGLAANKSITKIGGTAFAYCPSLKRTGLESNKTVKQIELNAFLYCTDLKSGLGSNTTAKPDGELFYPAIAACNVGNLSASYVATGAAIEPDIKVYDGTKVVDPKSYTLTYSNNSAPGMATVTIKGKGVWDGYYHIIEWWSGHGLYKGMTDYTGELKATFKIVPGPSKATSIEKAQVDGIGASYSYNGKAIRPVPTVKLDGNTLVEGSHYTVSYRNNTNNGTATVIITGKGSYTGTITRTFKIESVYAPDNGTASTVDCEIVGLPGKYETTATRKLIDRVNQIRQEAKNLGLIKTYTPIKWSYSLEYAAQIRAAEATFGGYQLAHDRPNGDDCFSVENAGNGEILAWGGNMSAGLEMWYSEKDNYIKAQKGDKTISYNDYGHYQQLITSKFIGMASFANSASGVSAQAGCLSSSDSTPVNTDKYVIGDQSVVQKIYVLPKYIQGSVTGAQEVALGDKAKLSVTASSNVANSGNVAPTSSVSWTSSNPGVAAVDGSGLVTGKGEGSTTIKAFLGKTELGSLKVTVARYVTVSFNSNGGSAVASQRVRSGDGVSRPADPTRSGYAFAGWYADAKLTKPFDFNAAVSGDLTLYAKWTKSATPAPKPESRPSDQFTDVTGASTWVINQGYLDYAVEKGLMTGYRDPATGKLNGKFGPEDTLTRGQVVVVLFRIANPGKPTDGGVTGFSDQGAFPYYRAAIRWLKDSGLATGDKDPVTQRPLGTFRPDANITRQELATLVYRFARYRGVNPGKVDAGSLGSFRDGSEVMPFAREAVAWCNAAGVITGGQGADAGKLMPLNNATRAQAAKIFSVLHRDVLKLGK